MAWTEDSTALMYVLAGLYPMTADSYRIVDAAEIPKMHVSFQPRGVDNWHQILIQAHNRGKVQKVIEAALKDYPDDPILLQLKKGEFAPNKGPEVGKDTSWNGEIRADALEKIMEQQSTLLPISFLEIGLEKARSIAKVELADKSSGTGFLTKNNFLVTNHHVIGNAQQAKTASAQFNYQQSSTGLELPRTVMQFDPDSGFATSFDDDWTVIKIKGDANAEWGVIELTPINIGKTAWVNIIQHPGGGAKQIALYHNIVAYADEKRVQYLTDTMPGSSGSPVFDSQWRLVAVHHSGGWILEPGTKRQVFRNEGISTPCILKGLDAIGFVL